MLYLLQHQTIMQLSLPTLPSVSHLPFNTPTKASKFYYIPPVIELVLQGAKKENGKCHQKKQKKHFVWLRIYRVK